MACQLFGTKPSPIQMLAYSQTPRSKPQWNLHEYIDIFYWHLLPIIFTSDEVTSENYWHIASRVTQKSLFTVTNVLFYFLHAVLCPWMHNSAKNNHQFPFLPLSLRTVFFDLALWSHYSWSVTSRERCFLALWHHIRRLFLHAQIGAKAIFTDE